LLVKNTSNGGICILKLYDRDLQFRLLRSRQYDHLAKLELTHSSCKIIRQKI
jgi:hypothetical protein